MNFNFTNKNILFWILSILCFGILGLGFVKIREASEVGNLDISINSGANSGFLFAILGGYGNVISDIVWIKSYSYWQEKNTQKCIFNMELALSINPTRAKLWTMAANIIAYDTFHWIAQERGLKNTSQISRIQARKAISLLDRALEYLPDNRDIIVDKANIYIDKLNDLDNAITCYKYLIEQGDRALFVRRMYAKLLTEKGDYDLAISILEEILPELNEGSRIRNNVLLEINELKSKKDKK